MLENAGFSIREDADLVLTEKLIKHKFVFGHHENDIVLLKPSDIVFVESINSEIFVHTMEQKYTGKLKLYEYEGLFENFGFLRVHKSYVININMIKKIKASFNSKYLLEMRNQDKVEVSRSYYYKFKDKIGF